ncbi:MAG TPA: asparagine synthase (glutamine-hydrolyzing) [Verrucomicrobiae bacterium]|nr:asparagine synthase (glutamine-hydrolyzing) [Verrucomicrobiae bacterium]
MCGIAGMFDRSGKKPAAETALRRMLGMLRHRGPDEFGILLDHETGLGSARLSIVDLEGGSQPISNEDESLWIVFNGEIFNHVELREELQARGHLFRTASDTEVILHLFEEHGPDCLEKLNGQFAIAIWDRERRRLFLARDRLGVRPLFYTTLADGTLLFASEIKSIFTDPRVSRELAPKRVEEVFRFWAPLPGHTVFGGISELPPGHFLASDARCVQIQQYWSLDFPTEDPSAVEQDPEGVIEEFRALLVDACRIRLRADVPVGAYLSGGLDSSAIAAVVRKFTSNQLVTFSIAFDDEQFDESGFQTKMAAHLGTTHHVVRAKNEDIGSAFPEVIWHAETPLTRTAPAPMFLLSQLVRDNGFKVVLTGEGADEFLAGYDIFKENQVRRFWARQPASRRRPALLQRLYPDIAGLSQTGAEMLAAFFGEGLSDTASPFYSHAVRWRNNRRACRFLRESAGTDDPAQLREIEAVLPRAFSAWSPLARAQFLEARLFLSQYLLSSQGDRMAMAHSVEGRFPFLDFRLVEFCNALPARLKLRGLREKHLLKQAAEPWLPSLIRERPKRPYRAPIHRAFFNNRNPDYARDLLDDSALTETGFFKPAAVRALVRKIEDGSPVGETDDMALAGVLSTQLCHQAFVKNFRAAELQPGDRLKLCRLAPFEKHAHALS